MDLQAFAPYLSIVVIILAVVITALGPDAVQGF
jgi:hypothetical protein